MGGLDQLYQQVILDHARERHGEGTARVDRTSEGMVGESFQVNPTCGDEVTLLVRLAQPDPADGAPSDGALGPRIAELGWEGVGCSISRASLSVMSDLVENATLREVDELTEAFRALVSNRGEPLPDDRADLLEDAVAFVGVGRFPARIKCALLGWMALRDAVAKAVTNEGAYGAQEEDS